MPARAANMSVELMSVLIAPAAVQASMRDVRASWIIRRLSV